MKYTIAVMPNYYKDSHGFKQAHFLRVRDIHPEEAEEGGLPKYLIKYFIAPASKGQNIVLFNVQEDAEAVARWLTKRPYVLSHNEAGRPTYSVLGEDGYMWGDDCYKSNRERELGYHVCSFDDLAKVDLPSVYAIISRIPEHVRESLMKADVWYWKSGVDYDTYIKEIHAGDKTYTVAFWPKALALQYYDGDESKIDWCGGEVFERDREV